jgi:hypothetical protein
VVRVPLIFVVMVALSAILTIKAKAQVADPLAAMNGRWTSSISGDCATKWFQYSVSSDRGSYTTRYPDGSVHVSIILQTEPNKVYLFHSNEKRRTPQGDLLTWWLIFEGPNTYRMRPIDGNVDELTQASWRRCE